MFLANQVGPTACINPLLQRMTVRKRGSRLHADLKVLSDWRRGKDAAKFCKLLLQIAAGPLACYPPIIFRTASETLSIAL